MKQGRPISAMIACTAMILSLFVTTGFATMLAKMALPDLVTKARVILIGQVLHQSSHQVAGQVVTKVTLSVTRRLKGTVGPKMTVTIPGGTIGDLRMRVSGAPVFEPNEEVILLTEATPDGEYIVVGMSQGKFSIVTDQSGRKVLKSDPQTTVETFVKQIEEIMQKPRK